MKERRVKMEGKKKEMKMGREKKMEDRNGIKKGKNEV